VIIDCINMHGPDLDGNERKKFAKANSAHGDEGPNLSLIRRRVFAASSGVCVGTAALSGFRCCLWRFP
jgi:hypothetical protein